MKTKSVFIVIIVLNVLFGIYAIFHKSNVKNLEAVSMSDDFSSEKVELPAVVSGDGLKNPTSTSTKNVDKISGGNTKQEEFNNDNIKITKTHFEDITAHSFDSYKIEIKTDSGFIDITPDNFRTVEGADCALQEFRFIFAPTFKVIEISRPFKDSWITPTMASKTVYELKNNKLEISSRENLKEVCDVSELF